MAFLVKRRTGLPGPDTGACRATILCNYENIFNFEQLTLCEQGKKTSEAPERQAVRHPKKLYLTFVEALIHGVFKCQIKGKHDLSLCRAQYLLSILSQKFASNIRNSGDTMSRVSGLLESAIDLLLGLANALKQGSALTTCSTQTSLKL